MHRGRAAPGISKQLPIGREQMLADIGQVDPWLSITRVK